MMHGDTPLSNAPLCPLANTLFMYYLFHQLRISKSELESKLGKGLRDRHSPSSSHHFRVSFIPTSCFLLQPLFHSARVVQGPSLPQRGHDRLASELAAAGRNGRATSQLLPSCLWLMLTQIFALHPFPYLHSTFQLDILGIVSVYQVEQIFIICMFLRFYTVVRYLREREAVQVRHLQEPTDYRFNLRADASFQKASQRIWHGCVNYCPRQALHQLASISLCSHDLRVQLHHQHILHAYGRYRRCVVLASHLQSHVLSHYF